MVKSIQVSVAIPCYDREESLLICLHKIASCDPLPQEVLVHADGGWTPQEVQTRPWPFPVRVIQSTEQVGPGGGRDRMIREAACDYVASFDDDSWPLDIDYFVRAKTLLDAFPNAAVLGANVFLAEKPVCDPIPVVEENSSFDGSASVHRRSIYLKLPGYVPLAAAYGMEEADLSLQAHAAGFEIVTSQWLRAWHDRPRRDYEHSTLPWVRNEWLQALLRYPWYAQPLGWLRVVRRVQVHAGHVSLVALLKAAFSSFDLASRLKPYRRCYSLAEIYRHHRGVHRRWGGAPGSAETEPLERWPELTSQPRIMYLQYTNPGSYPPLEHSSTLLSRRGWQIMFLGVIRDPSTALALPKSQRIEVKYLSAAEPGIRQKLHYILYAHWCLWQALCFRPSWLYCSDMLAAPATLLLLRVIGCRVVYHEHDSPTETTPTKGWVQRLQLYSRKRLAKISQAVVLPNQERLEALITESPPNGKTLCVWNCPGGAEPRPERHALADGDPIRLLYHGSINCERFPLSYLECLAVADRRLSIRLVGYETEGSRGYTAHLQELAVQLGVSDRFEYLGPQPLRRDLIARCAECDVGLSLLRIHDGDINMQHMAGASNKPFDYLSQGLALVVPNDPAWRVLFVDNGCAISCDLEDKQALVDAFNWLATHPNEIRAMGRRGQELVATQWNYDAQFKPVLELLESTP